MKAIRTVAAAVVFMALATVASAAPTTTPAPDYSRDTILKVLHQADVEAARYRLTFGNIRYTTKTTRFHFAYLPFLKSIPYAGPNGASKLPNPFVLTNMEFPYAPGQYVAGPLDYERTAEEEREFRKVMKLVAKRR
jgi:hypothetical protein